jgi:Gas vesicle synthesis protein GvpL/GvpF
VRRDRVDALEEELEVMAEALHERIRLRLVGPVAPYDFVEDGPWA